MPAGCSINQVVPGFETEVPLLGCLVGPVFEVDGIGGQEPGFQFLDCRETFEGKNIGHRMADHPLLKIEFRFGPRLLISTA